MRKSAWNEIANWQTKRQEQLYTFSSPCFDHHQSFLLNDIFMVILQQDCYGKVNLRKKPFEIRLREGFQIGNVSLFIVKKDYSYLCMWMTSNWLERNKILIRCGKYSIKKSIWENQHLSWIMYTWAALNDNVK